MSELNLGGSTADPDRGAIRRTSVGGSMRMPPPPDLQDNQFSSARHSIDTSYAASNRSRSRHSTASSEAYSSFSEEPAIAPQPKKSGGLKSFLKTVKKAFVPSSGRKSSEGSRQQTELVLESTLRMDFAKRGRADAGPDERLFSEFRTAMDEARERGPDNSHAANTVRALVSFLRGFSVWLQLHPRYLTIAELLDDNDSVQLAARAAEFVGEGGDKRVHRALEVLRDSQAGNLTKSRAGNVRKSRPAPEDERLFSEFRGAMDEARNRDPKSSHAAQTVTNWITALRGFSVWLQSQSGNLTIADLLDDTDNLAACAAAFVNKGGDKRVHRALKALRDPPAGNVRTRRTLAPYPDDARLIDGLCKHSFGPEATAAQRKPVNDLASRQRGFSDWLRREGKASIASRLNGNREQIDDGLKDDFRAFKKANGPTGGGVALDKLQKYQRVVAANEAWRMPPEQAGWPQQSGQSPASSYDPDPLWDELSERGRQGPAASLDSYDQDEIHDAADQAGGRQPAGWEDGSWALSSQSDQPAPSPQSLNPTEFWAGVDQAGPLPADSFNTASFWQGMPPPAPSPAQSVDQPSPATWEQDIGASIFGPTYHQPASFDFEQHVPPDWGVPPSFPGPSTRTPQPPDDWQEHTASPPAAASLPDLPVGPFRQSLPTFLRRFNADVGQASGQGLNCLLDTVLQFAHNTRRQDHETAQTEQLQQQARFLRDSLVQISAVDPDGEIDLYAPGGVGAMLAHNFGVRIQVVAADARGRLTVHPILGQEGRLVHILHTPGHFQPLWPRH
ncbi:hypothetical protein [Mesorhizobium sp. L-2-11]|uniref:hypothetical protein n=1 Tax=Mesorhizobium sp. L-2-11 TaxID=2744521 RepID=UPI001925D616|nr:hypothetical protein [Mesorhizobium sp. L-2-11]